jgi:hypothetical protein
MSKFKRKGRRAVDIVDDVSVFGNFFLSAIIFIRSLLR